MSIHDNDNDNISYINVNISCTISYNISNTFNYDIGNHISYMNANTDTTLQADYPDWGGWDGLNDAFLGLFALEIAMKLWARGIL